MPLALARPGESIGFHVYPTASDEGTLGAPERIIWASIKHLCSRNVALELAWSRGIKTKRDRENVAWNLKLYVRQAAEFCDTAGAAKPNTAPLIYYYSFLNLAKAVCELEHAAFHRTNECYRHGLSWKSDPKKIVNPERESVSVTTRGVWHSLWEALSQRPCPAPNPTRLNIKHLFSLCPEVAVENRGAFQGPLNLLDIPTADVLFDESVQEAWLKFSVKRDAMRGFGVSAKELVHQLATTRSSFVEVRSTDKELRTFQSAVAKKIEKNRTIAAEMWPDILGLNVFTHFGFEKKLRYCLPVQKVLPITMPQLMVAYTILFWLGSLVRYDPHSVDWLMDSQYWILIDGFMSQSRVWLLELFEWALYRTETTLLASR
jgi:hypothetical protein